MALIKKILFLLNRREKISLFFLIGLMLFGAVLETVGIGLIVPYIGLIANPGLVEKHKALATLRHLLGPGSYEHFIIVCGLGLIAFYILKNIFLAVLIVFQNRFTFRKYVAMSKELMTIYLRQPYSFHLTRNSAELVQSLHQVGVIFQNAVLIPLLTAVAEMTVIVFITALLMITEPVIALTSLIVLGGITAGFFYYLRKDLKHLAVIQHESSIETIKWLQQSFGGVKEAIIFGKEDYFIKNTDISLNRYTVAASRALIIGSMPKFFIETISLSGIILIVCIQLASGKNLTSVLPTLALFALAAVRIMPSMNRIVSSLTCVKNYQPAVDAIYSEFRSFEKSGRSRLQEKPTSFPFLKELTFEKLSFAYPSIDRAVLKNLSLTIPKGQSAAFVGSSGAGKTTLIDLMMGLLEPSSGRILVDSTDIQTNLAGWRQNIGYVPQSIFLTDDSIRRNIAFGVEDLDIREEELSRALRAAQLYDFVQSLPEGLDTFVGERGIRLSGGQKQRIGIARALYHNPEVLIFDEATSALDYETELEITNAIGRLSSTKTIILITHRLNTAATCNTIYKIIDGALVIGAKSAPEAVNNANLV